MVVDACMEAYFETSSDTLGLFDSRPYITDTTKCESWLLDSKMDNKIKLNTPSSMDSQDASSTLDVISEILFADDCRDNYTPGKHRELPHTQPFQVALMHMQQIVNYWHALQYML